MRDGAPLPDVTPEAEPYWEAAQREVLRVQRCENCDQYIFPPKLVCPYCHEDAFVWEESAGRGDLYTFSVVHHPPSEYWRDEVPYVIAMVRLDPEDVFLLSHLVNCEPENVSVGMSVEVTFERITEDVTLPKFEPAPGTT